MAKMQKPRRLWLRVLFKVPEGVPRKQVLDTLINSIETKTYTVPAGWRVVLQWRNKESAPMKTGEFSQEMKRSAQSSTGFDSAVISYLEGQY